MIAGDFGVGDHVCGSRQDVELAVWQVSVGAHTVLYRRVLVTVSDKDECWYVDLAKSSKP